MFNKIGYFWKLSLLKFINKIICQFILFSFYDLVTKDGHIKIFNTISSDLIRTIISPEIKEPNQLYSEVPSIHIFDDLSMLYGINNKLLHFSI